MATGSTANYSFPYPLSTDPVNVSGDIESLANKIDSDLSEIVEDTTSAQWSGGSFTNGLLAPTYNESTGKFSMSISQNVSASGSPSFVDLTLTGDANINGGDLNTTQTSFNLLNSIATDINFAGSASTLTIGATSGNANIRNATVTLDGDLAVNGGDITTSQTTFNLLNTNATTLNIGGSASVISVGASVSQINAAGDMNVASGKVYKINNTEIISSTTLGSSVVNSSLTSVGTIATGIWNATTIAVDKGGTGLTSYTSGDIVYASASTTLAKLSGAATGNALISGGTTGAPSWGKIGLTTHVSGTLPISNGGTNVSSTPSNGQLLIGNGTGYTLATLTAGTNITITNSAGSVTIESTGGGGGDAGLQDILMFAGM
jgi:hypothetical protein